MNHEIKFPQLPFLTREMLKFGNTAKLELVLSTMTSLTVDVVVKGFTKSGVISIKQTTTPNAYPKQTIQQIDDIPIMIGIETIADAVQHGEIFASLSLKLDGQIIFTFISGFLTTVKGLSWPASNLQDTVPNRGHFTKITSADPDPGNNIWLQVPLGEIWHIRSAYIILITDANVANRYLNLFFNGIKTGQQISLNNGAQTANQTKKNYFTVVGGKTSVLSSGYILTSIPKELWLLPGDRIETDVYNMQAGDNLSALEVGYEKFFAGDSF